MSVLVLQTLVVFSLSLMVPMDSLLIVPSMVAQHKERVLPGPPHYTTLRTYLTLNADQVAFLPSFFWPMRLFIRKVDWCYQRSDSGSGGSEYLAVPA